MRVREEEEKLMDYTLVEVIVSRCTTEQLMTMYNVSYFNNAHEFLVLLAQQRGKLKKVFFFGTINFFKTRSKKIKS